MHRTAYATILLAAAFAPITAAPANPTEATIPYQGRLDNSGQAFTGAVDMSFNIWSERIGGDQLEGPIDIADVQVTDGLFNVELTIDTAGLPLTGYWIEIEVDSVVLSPRQPYRPAAAAVQASGAERVDADTVVLGRSLNTVFLTSSVAAATKTEALPSVWQSFVAVKTGIIAELQVGGSLLIGDTIKFRIYEGTGIGGSLLAEYDAGSFSIIQALVEDGVLIEAGSTYTLETLITDSGSGLPGGAEFQIVGGDSYPDGRASTATTEDLRFAIGTLVPGSARVFTAGSDSLVVDGQLRVQGNTSTLSGIDAVALPINSIERTEIADEPGISSNAGIGANLTTTGATSIRSDTIDVPAPGYIFAVFAAELEIPHNNGTASSYTIGLSLDPSTLPNTQDFQRSIPLGAASGLYDNPYNVSATFRADTAGSYTVHAVGGKDSSASPDAFLNDTVLTLIYFPTAYGSVSVAATGSGAIGSTPGSSGSGLHPADVGGQTADSEVYQNELESFEQQIPTDE